MTQMNYIIVGGFDLNEHFFFCSLKSGKLFNPNNNESMFLSALFDHGLLSYAFKLTINQKDIY